MMIPTMNLFTKPEFVDAKIYSDFGALKSLHGAAERKDVEALKAAAKQFEALFLQMMMKGMRSAGEAFESDLIDKQHTKVFQEMLDKQVSLEMANKPGGTFGIADMLVKQLKQYTNAENAEPTTSTVGFFEQFQQGASAPTKVAASTDAVEELPGKPGKPGRAKSRRFQTAEAFVAALLPQAQKAAKILGVDPKVLVAQAALETGWGRSIIQHKSGDNSHNLFGIKANRSWEGDKAVVATHEYYGGQKTKEYAAFRSYDSYADSFEDYVNFLQSNPRYRDALSSTGDPYQFTEALQKAGYATDPQYANKIMRLYQHTALQE